MPNYTLPRSERLRSLKAIRRMFGEGRGGFVYPFRYIWIADKQEGESEGRGIEVMFSVPKKFHKRANKRNLLRRRMREVYRLNKSLIYNSLGNHRIEIAVVYSSKTIHNYRTIENGVKKILEQISAEL